MRPLTVINAIVFGSAVAISFGLTSVIIIYLILKGRHPELVSEFVPLLKSSAQFISLAAVSGASLLAMLKGLRWRWIAQMAMWFTAVGIGLVYWPR
jgi:ABC-type transport system involved in cytochrome c biogenesis permease subunit